MENILKISLLFLTSSLLISSAMEFINKPEKLDLNNLEILKMNKNNPILICEKNFVEKENDMVSLDKIHSQFELSTYKNNFSYARIFIDFILKKNINRETILVLGFGLGGIPLELSLDNKTKEIDGVDINICMFKLYNSLIKNKSKKLHYYLSDATVYLKNTPKTYDIIIDDAFHYYRKNFYDFESGYNKLNKDGWLLINMHSMNDYNKYESLLKKFFKNIQIDTTLNICVFCQKK
jgi:spermidine synthase